MQNRLRSEDITHYVLNELDSRERLYVESMMLDCEASREDVAAMMETVALLEEGEAELTGLDLRLDAERRSMIFAQQPSQIWEGVWRVAATAAALAACVAFSVAAPVIAKLAFRGESSKAAVAARQIITVDAVLAEEDPAAFPILVVGSGDSQSLGSALEDVPSRVLLPTGAVNFADMPMPYLGGDAN
jgi:anti-sigma factor RsiW